ncbi:hypothetical protein VP01_992g1 [Puccinia sorghi]|uniref:Uncharacterized protein n=1 Tax=Puccinia sorghi TaxID=27349 RepID=A0A0L6U5D5_9BASI|nr:hypothetical protein VP01_992g1 [Puccinia sorghi]
MLVLDKLNRKKKYITNKKRLLLYYCNVSEIKKLKKRNNKDEGETGNSVFNLIRRDWFEIVINISYYSTVRVEIKVGNRRNAMYLIMIMKIEATGLGKQQLKYLHDRRGSSICIQSKRRNRVGKSNMSDRGPWYSHGTISIAGGFQEPYELLTVGIKKHLHWTWSCSHPGRQQKKIPLIPMVCFWERNPVLGKYHPIKKKKKGGGGIAHPKAGPKCMAFTPFGGLCYAPAPGYRQGLPEARDVCVMLQQLHPGTFYTSPVHICTTDVEPYHLFFFFFFFMKVIRDQSKMTESDHQRNYNPMHQLILQAILVDFIKSASAQSLPKTAESDAKKKKNDNVIPYVNQASKMTDRQNPSLFIPHIHCLFFVTCVPNNTLEDWLCIEKKRKINNLFIELHTHTHFIIVIALTAIFFFSGPPRRERTDGNETRLIKQTLTQINDHNAEKKKTIFLCKVRSEKKIETSTKLIRIR